MFKPLLILLLLSLNSAAFSQTDDAEILKASLPKLKNAARVDGFNAVSEAYFNKGFFGTNAKQRIDSMYHYAQLANYNAKLLQYKKGLNASYLNLAISHICRYEFAEAEKNVKLALSDNTLSPFQLGVAHNFLHAIYFEGYNKPNEAMAFLKKALEHFKKSGNHKEIGNTASFLCQRYTAMAQYEEGLEYCKLSMQMFEKFAALPANDGWLNIQILRSLHNMARIFKAAGDYQTSLDYLHQLQNEVVKRKEDFAYEMFAGELHALNHSYDSSLYFLRAYLKKSPENMFTKMQVGKVLVEQKKYHEAIPVLKECLDSFYKRSATGRPNANINYLNASLLIGKSFFEAGNKQQSKQILQAALSKFPAFEKHMLPSDRYEWAYQAFTYLENADSALSYLKKYNRVKDSMLTKQFLFKLNSYKKEAEDEKRESYIALLQKQHQLQEQQLIQESLQKKQKEAEIEILSKNNELKDQRLQQEAYLMRLNKDEIALLNKDIQLKTQQLQQEALIKKIFAGGTLLLITIFFFIYKWLSLQKKNERLKNEQLVQTLKMQQLENDKKQAELQHQATELEMQALRSQMNPHFIFNCLSSINRFILKNETEEASHYLTRFSRLIRMVLIHSQNSFVPLEDEIELLKLYLDMEKLRFDNLFEYTIDTSDMNDETVFIPPLLLQPFCENAVWHGLMHKKEKGKLNISISANDGFLNCVITDNGIGRKKAAELKSKSVEKDKSLGLKITSERLALLNKDHHISQAYVMEDVLDEGGGISGTRINLKIRYIKHSNY